MSRYRIPTSQGLVTRTSARRHAAGWQPKPSFHRTIEAARQGTWRSVKVVEVIAITDAMVAETRSHRRQPD